VSILESIFSWSTAYWLLLVLYILCCVVLIGVVLLQKGKGSGFAGAFGVGGGSDAVFGPRASKSLPARLTTIMASIFLFLAFSLSLIEGKQNRGVAPEKMSEQAATDNLSGLDAEGIGKGDAAVTTPETSAPAPAVTAPAPAAQEAPAAVAPATPAPATPTPSAPITAPVSPDSAATAPVPAPPAAAEKTGTPSAN